MNREIKFRAWDTDDKLMCTFPEKIHIDGKIVSMINASSNKIVMQYTGLKDKNGVEIYELDILKTNYLGQKYYIVTYEDRSFELFDGGDGVVFDPHDDWSEFEVVGNIYENKDLIEQ